MGRTGRTREAVSLDALKIVSIKQLCSTLGIHRATAHRWVRHGHLPAPRQLGPGRVGWLAREIAAWIESRPHVVGAPQAPTSGEAA